MRLRMYIESDRVAWTDQLIDWPSGWLT